MTDVYSQMKEQWQSQNSSTSACIETVKAVGWRVWKYNGKKPPPKNKNKTQTAIFSHDREWMKAKASNRQERENSLWTTHIKSVCSGQQTWALLMNKKNTKQKGKWFIVKHDELSLTEKNKKQKKTATLAQAKGLAN